MRKIQNLWFAASFVAISSTISLVASADTLKPVLDKSSAINQSAKQSQERIDRLAEVIDSKLQQYKTINKETDGLVVYNKQMDRQIQNQLLEMQKLNGSIDKVSVIERQITPLMLRMIKGLEDFVSLDVPFLSEERERRLSLLNDMMDRADVAVSEKFRRILEAYQVEVDYGRTIEAYTGVANVNGSEQDVNYLRIGRIALVYQTRDKNTMGVWNQETRGWEALDNEYRNQISNGLKMARKQKAPDMIVVPVPPAKAK